mgnify:CR=1 FL=1
MTTELNEAPSPMDVLRMNIAALRNLNLGDLDRYLTPEEFRHIFETCDTLWLHSGDPKDAHAELTSGLCSNGFADVLRTLKYSNLCEIMAGQLVRQLRRYYDGRVDWVIGSDHAGATLSYAVAAQLSAQHDFTEKGEGKKQNWKRFVIKPEEVVLQVEELITTAGTLEAVREGIRAGNPNPVKFAPLSLALVHRSDVYEFEGAPIIYAAHYDIKTWAPEKCPLCSSGSERLRPKERQNWAKLTGRK